jgi:hypothetical protein
MNEFCELAGWPGRISSPLSHYANHHMTSESSAIVAPYMSAYPCFPIPLVAQRGRRDICVVVVRVSGIETLQDALQNWVLGSPQWYLHPVRTGIQVNHAYFDSCKSMERRKVGNSSNGGDDGDTGDGDNPILC